MNNNAGKGDKPRNCFSDIFKNNYDEIDWGNYKSYTPYWKKSLDYKKLTDELHKDHLEKILKSVENHPEIVDEFSKKTKSIGQSSKNFFIKP